MISPLKAKTGPKSIKLYWRVIRAKLVSMGALGFLAVMKTFGGKLGIIPRVETLAAAAGINRKTVFKYLGELKEAGLIKVVHRTSRGQTTSSCYLLEDEKLAEKLALNSVIRVPKNGTRPLSPEKGDSRSTFKEDEDTEEDIDPLPQAKRGVH